MLYEVWPENVYCGPAALTAVTGLDAKGEIRTALNRAKRRKHNAGICGVSTDELEGAMNILGIKFTKHLVFKQNLSKFCENHNGKWIIEVTKHYVAVEDNTVFDNRIRFGCDISEHPCKRMKVHSAYQIL